MKDKNGKILIFLDENYGRAKLSDDKIYFLSHPCTNGNRGEKSNREKEAELYNLFLSEIPRLKVIRPLTIIPDKADYDWAMWVCYKLMSAATCVIFASGWQQSKGCKLEHKYCIENDIPRLYVVEEDVTKVYS